MRQDNVAGRGVVRRNRLALAKATRINRVRRNPLLHQVIANRLGAMLRQILMAGAAANWNLASISKFAFLPSTPGFARGALEQIGATKIHFRCSPLQSLRHRLGGTRDGGRKGGG
jgi:hypothetical protein